MNEELFDPRPAKKVFSRIGFSMTTLLVLTTVLQVIVILALGNLMATSPWAMWLGTFSPMYLIGIPTGLWMMRKLPAEAPQESRLSKKNFLIFFVIGLFLMYFGNFIGIFLSGFLSGGSAENALDTYAMDNHPLKVLFMVILAPLLEEYVCRKAIIDRTRRYGEKVAVMLSALIFALMHQNLFQFFYAFALGLVFAYIYIRTGRLRYPIILHAIYNFMGSVIAPWILTLTNTEAMTKVPNASPEMLADAYAKMLPGLLLAGLYAMVLIAGAIAGFVLLLIKGRKLIWQESPEQLPRGTVFKTVYVNGGMIVYTLLCLSSILLALV